MKAPRIGYLDVADPRLPAEMQKTILGKGKECASLLRSEGLDIVEAGGMVTTESEARRVVSEMRNREVDGIIVRCAWFLRANVVAGVSQYAESLPVMLWAVANPNDTSFEGLALAHGSLDEIGARHHLHYGRLTSDDVAPVVAWAQACRIKRMLVGAVYGEIGGRCLEMLPGSSDPNQLRKLFGIHVDPLEQWTLIRRAEEVPESEWKPVVDRVRDEYKVVDASDEALARSAKLYVAGNAIFEERGWTFAGIQCQLEMIDNYLAPCLPVALWNEEGFTVSCETDVNNALGMLVCREITGRPPMFADLFYLDPERRVLHCLNCGTGAPSLGGGPEKVEVHDQTPLQGTRDEATGRSLCKGGACSQFILQPGPVTIVRFGRIDGRYVIHLARGEAIPHEFDPEEVSGLTRIWPFAYIQLPPGTDAGIFLRNMRSHHAVISPGEIVDPVSRFADQVGIEVIGQPGI